MKVTCYPAPYRKLKRPCRYCGSIIKIETHFRLGAHAMLLRPQPLTLFCSTSCCNLYQYMDEERRRFYLMQHAKVPAGSQPRFPRHVTLPIPIGRTTARVVGREIPILPIAPGDTIILKAKGMRFTVSKVAAKVDWSKGLHSLNDKDPEDEA